MSLTEALRTVMSEEERIFIRGAPFLHEGVPCIRGDYVGGEQGAIIPIDYLRLHHGEQALLQHLARIRK